MDYPNKMNEKNIDFPWRGKYPVLVIAHRGLSRLAPENTISAFRKAMDVGSDVIELDIHFSKDREVVVIHDDRLERTTTGKGKVGDYDLKELKKLDAGSWFGAEFAGEPIPTLNEVLKLARGRILVNIEIKKERAIRFPIEDLSGRAFSQVQKAGMIEQVTFSSFHPPALEILRGKKSPVRIALLFHGSWSSVSEVTRGRSYTALNLQARHLTEKKIASIHEQGMRAIVYTVNAEKKMRDYIRWRADGIITNQADRLIRILQQGRSVPSPSSAGNSNQSSLNETP
jgi:glycerophosphoryl diester phosphodiesterase